MRWMRREDEKRWVMRNRYGVVVDSVTDDELETRPRRQREKIVQSAEDDLRYD